MQKLYIIKIGGNVIDDDRNLSRFLSDLATLKENIILVHGGGKVATELSKGLGIEVKMMEGRRVTDAETLKIVTMVYGGLINKKIVAILQSKGINALGLTGADANIISAVKRLEKDGLDYGYVGDITHVHQQPLTHFLSMGLTPVIAPLTHDGEGSMLNTNADTMASALAVAMAEKFSVQLIYCFELPGVLKNIEQPESVISFISEEEYTRLKSEGVISKGMIPKLDNAFAAIREGVSTVRICHANDLASIINAKENKGTTLGHQGKYVVHN